MVHNKQQIMKIKSVLSTHIQLHKNQFISDIMKHVKMGKIYKSVNLKRTKISHNQSHKINKKVKNICKSVTKKLDENIKISIKQ